MEIRGLAMKMPDAIDLMNKWGSESIPFLFLIDFEQVKPEVFQLKELGDSQQILYEIHGRTNAKQAFSRPLKALKFSKQAVEYQTYKYAFNRVANHLQRGDSYLLNLTFSTPITFNYSLKEIFYASKARYKILFRDQFVVYSPEIFVQVKGDRIYSHPMKGTIDASVPDAEKMILENRKEQAEHVTIVDLIRNDLSMVAKDVKVEQFRYLDRIKTHQKEIIQVSSRISGVLPANWRSNIGAILSKLLPAGSISGAPKAKTLEIIRNVEMHQRGYYTGICGLFDGTNLDCGVMIRFIEKHGQGYVYKSGGGITVNSDPEAEYREMIDKVYVPFI